MEQDNEDKLDSSRVIESKLIKSHTKSHSKSSNLPKSNTTRVLRPRTKTVVKRSPSPVKSSRLRPRSKKIIRSKSPSRSPVKTKSRRKTATVAVKPISSSSEIVNTPESPIMTDIDRPWLTPEYISNIFSLLSSDNITTQEQPELLVLVGPPASGKSTIKKQLHFNNAVNIDVDEIQIQTTNDFGNPSVFKVVKDYPIFIQIMGKMAVTNRYNMILDTTGKMKAPIKYVIHLAKLNGYKVTMAFVYSTLSKCEERVMVRKDTDPRRRAIPVHAIRKTYDDFIKSKIVSFYLLNSHQHTLMEKVNNLYLFDNSGDSPRAETILERHENVTNVHMPFPNFYEINVINESPYFTKV
jgi:predicted kinase